jgi:hypothetical protein
MLGAYLQGFDSLFLSDHQPMVDKLNYGSDAFPRKHAAIPRNEQWTGPSVRNVGLGHTMQAQDVSNIQFSVLLSPVVGVHLNEMSRLGKTIDDYPNGVKLAGRER